MQLLLERVKKGSEVQSSWPRGLVQDTVTESGQTSLRVARPWGHIQYGTGL